MMALDRHYTSTSHHQPLAICLSLAGP